MSDDVYLNALHDLERGVVLCFVEGRDGGAVNCHIRLRQSGLRDDRVRDDADVGDEPAELDVGAAGAAEKSSDVDIHYFKDRETMTQELLSYVKEGDTILVKASHFMEFPEVVEALSK